MRRLACETFVSLFGLVSATTGVASCPNCGYEGLYKRPSIHQFRHSLTAVFIAFIPFLRPQAIVHHYNMKFSVTFASLLVSALAVCATPVDVESRAIEARAFAKRGLSFNTVSTTKPFANV